MLTRQSPDTGTTTYCYDSCDGKNAIGERLSKTDAHGQTTGYQYDALGRISQTSYHDGQLITYHYDTALNGIGRLAAVSDASGSTTWNYDAHGRIREQTQTIVHDGNSWNLQSAYTYNGAGQLQSMNYPSGHTLDFSYNKDRLTAVSLDGQSLISAIEYAPFGPIKGWNYANGLIHNQSIDLDGRISRYPLGHQTRTVGYDTLNNITSLTDSRETQGFAYDALNRLTQASGSGYLQSLDYDTNGNRTYNSIGNQSIAIAPDSNRLVAYGYDANGNIIDDGNHRYQYDARNRLRTVDNGETAAYQYNALGQRVLKRMDPTYARRCWIRPTP